MNQLELHPLTGHKWLQMRWQYDQVYYSEIRTLDQYTSYYQPEIEMEESKELSFSSPIQFTIRSL